MNILKLFIITISLTAIESTFARTSYNWTKPRFSGSAKCYKFSGVQSLHEVEELNCKDGFTYRYAKPAFKARWGCYKIVNFGTEYDAWKGTHEDKWFPVREMDEYFCETYGEKIQNAIQDYENGLINYY